MAPWRSRVRVATNGCPRLSQPGALTRVGTPEVSMLPTRMGRTRTGAIARVGTRTL